METLAMKVKLQGDHSGKEGRVIRYDGKLHEILSVESTHDCYELDGITYRDQYPGEESDLEWTESVVVLRLLSDEEVAERKEQKAQREKERQEQLEQKVAEQEAVLNERKDSFERFLAGEKLERVWSGYDLPNELYTVAGSPLKTKGDNYEGESVGNSLGYWCSSDALTELYEFAFAHDNDWQERLETFANPSNFYLKQWGQVQYLAGSQYYRWIKKVKLGQ
jgi:hypothetical protein